MGRRRLMPRSWFLRDGSNPVVDEFHEEWGFGGSGERSREGFAEGEGENLFGRSRAGVSGAPEGARGTCWSNSFLATGLTQPVRTRATTTTFHIVCLM